MIAAKILRFQLHDLGRSRWVLGYTLLLLALTEALLRLGGGGPRATLSLMNVVLTVVPLVSIVFGTMYLYGAREFIELLLAQPVGRRALFAGLYGGLALPLAAGFLLGVGLPFLWNGSDDGSGSGSDRAAARVRRPPHPDLHRARLPGVAAGGGPRPGARRGDRAVAVRDRALRRAAGSRWPPRWRTTPSSFRSWASRCSTRWISAECCCSCGSISPRSWGTPGRSSSASSAVSWGSASPRGRWRSGAPCRSSWALRRFVRKDF